MKKALIFDLDNTIYPVPSLGHQLFKPLFEKIASTGKHDDDMEGIKEDVMRIPFQAVAEKYNLDEELAEACTELLKTLEWNGPIQPFEDFEYIRRTKADKFLVTTGFKKMQRSKVKALKLDEDFKEIFIIDPTHSDKQKKDLFTEIIEKYNYKTSEVIVIGDDLDSEIKGATELGIETVYYSKQPEPGAEATYILDDFTKLDISNL